MGSFTCGLLGGAATTALALSLYHISMKADRNLDHIYPPLKAKVLRIAAYLKAYLDKNHPGYEARVIEGFRSRARQVELYAQGRTKPGSIVTHKNGTTNPSDHQSAMAVDFGIFWNGRYVEEPHRDIWAQLQHAAHVEGLESGLDWKTFKDAPHVAWPRKDREAYKKAEAWKKSAGLV